MTERRLQAIGLWVAAVLVTAIVVHWSAANSFLDTVTGVAIDAEAEKTSEEGAVAPIGEPGPPPSPAPLEQKAEGSGNAISITAGDGAEIEIVINGRPAPDSYQEISSGSPAGEGAAASPDNGRADPESRSEAGSPMPRRDPAPAASPDRLQDLADELLGTMGEIVVPLMEREEYREEPYELAGIPHVCYGHQIRRGDVRPMTAGECVDLLAKDIHWALRAALDYVGEEAWFDIGIRRQGVIVELAYILGREGLLGFDGMRRQVRAGNWKRAVEELWDSNLPRDPENGGIGRQAVKKLALRLR